VLRSLTVRDFAIAERVAFEPGPGFTALTGETGAGKSLLVDAIGLLLGARADPMQVRAGAARAELEAEFDVAPASPLAHWLEEQGLAGDEPERLLLRRSLEADGRSRAFVNGRAVTLAQLREAGERLADIHGQHAHQSLLRPAGQREILDALAGAAALARDCAEAHRAWRRLAGQAEEAQREAARRAAEREELAAACAELERLAPRENEWEELEARQRRLANAASLAAGAAEAVQALAEAEEAIAPRLAAVAGRLRGLARVDAGLETAAALVEAAQAQADEAARELRRYGARLELDPAALAQVEARIGALHAAARRYRVALAELPALKARLAAQLAALERAADVGALEREVEQARTRHAAIARELSERRKAAARSLAHAVTEAMPGLGMPGGRFAVRLSARAMPGASGAEDIEFEVAAHAGAEPLPLARIASGGELSRIGLALQLVAARVSPVSTLVFDEVDAGIGGAVAEAVGRALARIGRERQVLCVTHLAQVAAQADAQWCIEKVSARGRVALRARRVEGRARVEEIARMLGGAQITPVTLRHAAELLGG